MRSKNGPTGLALKNVNERQITLDRDTLIWDVG